MSDRGRNGNKMESLESASVPIAVLLACIWVLIWRGCSVCRCLLDW